MKARIGLDAPQKTGLRGYWIHVGLNMYDTLSESKYVHSDNMIVFLVDRGGVFHLLLPPLCDSNAVYPIFLAPPAQTQNAAHDVASMYLWVYFTVI